MVLLPLYHNQLFTFLVESVLLIVENLLEEQMKIFCLLVMFLVSIVQANGQSYLEKGVRALDIIDWDWCQSLPNWEIKFHSGREGKLGKYDSKVHVIDIWVRTSQSPESVSSVIAHELAHAFDREHLNGSMHAEWLSVRKLPPNTAWNPPKRSIDDYGSGAGDFAECVSWTLQGPVNEFRSRLGPPPDETQKALIKRWLGM